MRSVVFWLTCASVMFGQDTGRITGSVVDPSGAVVPKASISILLHGGASPVAATATNSAGLFTVETLRPVFYDLRIEASGFEAFKLENVKVNPSRDTDLGTLKLDLAATATSVNVTVNGAETVQTTSTEISTTVT